MTNTIIKAASVIIFIMAVLGFALHVAHEHDNELMCKRYGGPGAHYERGSCWSPIGRLDG